MSSIKAEDRPKVIGLASAVGIVFLVGAINIIRTSLPGPPPPAATPSVASEALALASATPTAGATAAPPGPATIVESNGALPANGAGSPVNVLAIQRPNYGADPFRPIVPTAQPVTAPIPGFGPPIISQVSSAPLTIPSPTVHSSAPSAPLLPAPVVIPLRLTGVVGGTNALAMIGDGVTQHFLHRGDTFQDYTVVQIDEDSVTLRHGDVGKILRVGGEAPELISFGPAGSTSNKPETKVVATKPAAEATTGTSSKTTLLTKSVQNGRN